MLEKERLIKELLKKGYSKKDGTKSWDISKREFRYLNKDMAKSFLRLTEHPRYKATITDIEIDLIKKNVESLLGNKITKKSFNLINMGCVGGSKANAVISKLSKDFKIRYCPVNVNEDLVKLSLKEVKSKKHINVVDYHPVVSEDFDSLDIVSGSLRNSKYQRNIILLLGSLISSFDINDYLFKVSQSMFPGDYLVIGNGIRKGERFTKLETYKHPLFNDWLIHLMRLLDFKDDEVEYGVRFTNERLEGFYKIKINKTFTLNGDSLDFNKGDEIIVAQQRKFFEDELKKICEDYFEDVHLVKDKDEEYCLIFCKR